MVLGKGDTSVKYSIDPSTLLVPTPSGRAAGPSFAHFMKKYLELHPETTRQFKIPEGVGTRRIDGSMEYFTDVSPFPKTNIKKASEEGGMMF